MSTLDKSLDEIIAAKPRKASFRRKAIVKGGVKKPTTKSKATKPAAPKHAPTAPFSSSYSSDKVIISNLPLDIDQQAIKEYFQAWVGPIAKLNLSYNSKGKSTGVCSVIFRNKLDATKAVQNYNGVDIDNGKNKLKVELVVDPSKKPLAARLSPKEQKKEVSKGPRPAVKKPATKKKDAPKKKARRPKKTVEELDAEMNDYFETK